MNTYENDILNAKLRQQRLLDEAAHARLCQQTQSVSTDQSRRLLHQTGTLLISMGTKLQAQAQRELEPVSAPLKKAF